MMERILGSIPSKMSQRSKVKYFSSSGRLLWNEDSSDGRFVQANCKSLHRYIPREGRGTEDWEEMFDLIRKMLIFDPTRRLTLTEALRHPFFDKLPVSADGRSSQAHPSR
jgi:CDC-like kinase